MENNNLEKEYWGKSFFGSKLNTVLLLALIILMVFAISIMLKDKSTYLPIFEQDNLNNNTSVLPENDESVLAPVVVEKTEQSIGTESGIGWKKSSKFGLYLPAYEDANYVESYYLSPGQMGQGVPENQGVPTLSLGVGDVFRIYWGGPQSSCNAEDFGVFQYGVSTVTCLKGTRTELQMGNLSNKLSSEEIKIFGDFVLKNQ